MGEWWRVVDNSGTRAVDGPHSAEAAGGNRPCLPVDLNHRAYIEVGDHQAIGDEWRYRYQLVKYALFVEDSESVVQVPEKGRPSLEARRAQHFHRFGVDEAKPELAAEDVPPALSTL